MENNVYMKYGMAIFEKLKETSSNFEANRYAIENFLMNMVENHENVSFKYEPLESLDEIFVQEIKKYYSFVLGIPEDSFVNLVGDCFFDKKSFKGFGKKEYDMAVLYPSFKHELLETGISSHTPTVDIYLLNDCKAVKINTDDIDNRLENTLAVIDLSSQKIAEIWTKNHDATDDEKTIIATEIVGLFTIEQQEATRKEVLEYLANEVDEDYRRLL